MISTPNAKESTEKNLKENSRNLECLATISHEIRNPVNAIIGISRLLKNPVSEEERKEYIESLLETSESLLELVNNIMDLSKLGSPNLHFTEKECDLRRMVERNLSAHRPLLVSKGIEVRSEIDADLPSVVMTDPVKVNQVIWNLLSNAVKFTAQGAVTVCLKVEELTAESTVVKFIVKDTGIGISQKDMDCIFEAYNQGADETCLNYGGSGLGLAISKKIVEALGGKFAVESREGLGSEFCFTLRLKTGTKLSVRKPEEPRTLNGREKHMKILVVDDNRINCLLVEKLLENWKIEFDTATDGVEAVNKIKEKNFDIILMDYYMPAMNGLEATAEIRKMDGMKYSTLPIIGMTGSTERCDRKNIHATGFTDILHKPFRSEELWNKIVSYMDLPEQLCP